MKQKRIRNLDREKSDHDVMDRIIGGFRPERRPEPVSRAEDKPRSPLTENPKGRRHPEE